MKTLRLSSGVLPHMVNIKDFMNKYRAVMPSGLFIRMTAASIQSRTYPVSWEVIFKLDRKLEEYNAEVARLNACAAANDKGTALEKAGDIAQAIEVYESNIAEGCYPAAHSFDRLMILYRKAKDYANEIRVIQQAIKVLCRKNPGLRAGYKTRLERARQLLKDQKQKEKQKKI